MPVQEKRFKEFDITRALPLLLLPLVHTYEEMESINALSAATVDSHTWLYTLCLITPVFMICLGTNLAFSSKFTAKRLFRRGIQFLCWGVLLNFFRFFIPCAISSIRAGNTDLLWECLYYTLTPDIYDFVGVALLTFALFKKLNLSAVQILVVSFFALTADAVIPDFLTPNDYVNAFLGRFLWMNRDSCFPLLTWLIFPAAGYCFGMVYKTFENEAQRKQFAKRTFFVSLAGFVGMWVSLAAYGLDPLLIMSSPANDSITDLPNVLSLTCLAGVWFGLVYWFYHTFQSTVLCKGLVRISYAIVPYYFIQWVIIGWVEYLPLMGWVEEPVFTTATFWLFSTAVLVVSIVLAQLYHNYKAKRYLAVSSPKAKV